MNFLRFEGRTHICLKETLFLVVAQWHSKLFLLYSDREVTKTRFEEYTLVASSKLGYYWMSAGVTDLTAKRPQGVIVGLDWSSTLFKFFQWACHSQGLNISHDIIDAMVQRAQDAQGLSKLPDPLLFFRYSWVEQIEDSGVWTQRTAAEADGELYVRVKPTGWICTLPGMDDKLSGLQVKHPSPPSRAIISMLIEPFQAYVNKHRA